MPLVLGAAFAPREVEVVEEPQHEITVEGLQGEMLLSALAGLHAALAEMPAPVVHVDQPDLSAIVQAVTALKGPATAEEIAKAIKDELTPGEQPKTDTVLEKLTEALDRLDFRLKGLGSSGGASGGIANRIQNEPGTTLATQDAAQDVRYEWQNVAGTSVPLYSGSAAPGTPETTATWRVEKYGYITGPAGDAVPAVIQSATGAWSSRASLF